MPWAAAIGAVGAIGGALISSDSSTHAAHQQQDAANRASQTQLQMQQNAINQVAPWRNAGMGALQQYMQMLGINPQMMSTGMGDQPGQPTGQPTSVTGAPIGTSFGNLGVTTGGRGPTSTVPGGVSTSVSGGNPAQNITDWMQNLPGYQFQMGQGMSAIENSGAARGMQLSGNTMEALNTFGQGLAGTTFNSWLDRLNNMSTLGANASTGNATNIMQTSGMVGSNIIGAGNAAAAGTVGSANAINTGLGNAYNAYLNQQMMGNIFGGGSSGGGGSGDTTNVSSGSLGSGMFDLFGTGT